MKEKLKDNFKQITKEEECGTIIEVWNDNVEEEFQKISKLVDKYNYVAMDTEFPGIVFSFMIENKTLESEYRVLKLNVDHLKLIQVGISICDEKGRRIKNNHTWQFNLKYNLSIERYQPESINILKEAGIEFDKLKEKGIEPLVFGELLTTSGLVFNSDIHWITFHGTYDFSYLMKNVINQLLPPSSELFFKLVKIIFPIIYDIKVLIQEYEDKRNFSLTKLGNDLKIKRNGTTHQAGSDSLLTLKCFIDLKEKFFDNQIPLDFINKIYGLNRDSIIANLGYNFNDMIINNYNNINYNNYGMYNNEGNMDMNQMALANYQRQMMANMMNNNSNQNNFNK